MKIPYGARMIEFAIKRYTEWQVGTSEVVKVRIKKYVNNRRVIEDL